MLALRVLLIYFERLLDLVGCQRVAQRVDARGRLIVVLGAGFLLVLVHFLFGVPEPLVDLILRQIQLRCKLGDFLFRGRLAFSLLVQLQQNLFLVL